MKPTLKQIFDFGLEVVEKEKYRTNGISTKEYTGIRKAKRYNKNIITYSAKIWFNYSSDEISEYLNIGTPIIHKYITIINKSNHKQEQAEELYNSLMYLQNSSFTTFRAGILKDFKLAGGDIRSGTKLAKWLINRLYEIENK